MIWKQEHEKVQDTLFEWCNTEVDFLFQNTTLLLKCQRWKKNKVDCLLFRLSKIDKLTNNPKFDFVKVKKSRAGIHDLIWVLSVDFCR